MMNHTTTTTEGAAMKIITNHVVNPDRFGPKGPRYCTCGERVSDHYTAIKLVPKRQAK
jgi:hypothetical protein